MAEEVSGKDQQAAHPERGKVYFGDGTLDRIMREQGWIMAGDIFGEDGQIIPFNKPEGVKVVEIKPFDLPKGILNNFICYDPQLAEVRKVDWHQEGKAIAGQLLQEGWRLMDSNKERGVLVRSIPQGK